MTSCLLRLVAGGGRGRGGGRREKPGCVGCEPSQVWEYPAARAEAQVGKQKRDRRRGEQEVGRVEEEREEEKS